MSCSSLRTGESKFSPVLLGKGASFYILDTPGIEKNIDMVQQIRGRYGSDEFIMEALVVADQEGIFISLFNSFGTGMGELYYDGNSLSIESPVLPRQLRGEYIIADFQFCFYREEVLARALEASGLNFSAEMEEGSPAGDRTETRIISEKGTPLIEITKTPDRVRLRNLQRDYEYELWGKFS